MTRLCTNGGENGSLAKEFEQFNGISLVTSPVHSGSYALMVQPTSVTTAYYAARQFTSVAATGPYFWRTYFRLETGILGGAGAQTTIAYLHSTAASYFTTPMVSLKLTSGGTLGLMDGASPVGLGSSVLAPNTYYYLELKLDGRGLPGTRILEAKLNGSIFASTTTSSSTLTPSWYGVGANLGNSFVTSSGKWYFDDIAINDSTGSYQTGYPGEGLYVHLHPVGPGDTVETPNIVPFVIMAGSGASWQQVDDVPPDDGTTYVQHDTGGGVNIRADNHLITEPISGGVLAGSTISFIDVGMRGGSSATANTTRNLLARVKSKQGGTVAKSTVSHKMNSNIATNLWVTNDVTSGLRVPSHFYTMPDGGSWTITGTNSLTNMQAGYECESTNGNVTGGAAVTALWVGVEFVPPVTTATGSAAVEKDIAHIGTAVAGPFFGRAASERDLAYAGSSSQRQSSLGSLAVNLENVHATPDVDSISAEWGLKDPTSPHYEFLNLDLTAFKQNADDIGQFKFALREGAVTVNESNWMDLTTTVTPYSMPITGTVVDPTQLRVYVEVRKSADVAVTPKVEDIALEIVYHSVEQNVANAGTTPTVRIISDAVGLIDLVATHLVSSQNLLNAVGITDNVTFIKTTATTPHHTSLTLQGTVGVSDRVNVSDFIVHPTDSVGLTAAVHAHVAPVRSLTDTVGIFGSLLAQENMIVVLADRVAIVGNLFDVNVVLSAVCTDAVGLTDVFSVRVGARPLSDAIGIANTVARVHVHPVRICTNTVGVSGRATFRGRTRPAIKTPTKVLILFSKNEFTIGAPF